MFLKFLNFEIQFAEVANSIAIFRKFRKYNLAAVGMQQLQNYNSKIRKKKDKNLSLFLFLANSSMTQPGMKHKANMLYLSKEATNKDGSLKMQLLLSSRDDDRCPTETIWCWNGFFGGSEGGVHHNYAELPWKYFNLCK